MKKLVVLALSVLLMSTATQSFAQDNTTFKVVNFNVGSWEWPEDDTSNEYYINHLADYLMNQNAEILLLQEIDYNADTKDVELRDALLAGGYQINSFFRNEDVGSKGNVIISSFYAVPGTYQQYRFTTSDRIIQTVVLQTPYGNVRVFNTHTKSECSELSQLINYQNQFPDPNIIVAGDMNMYQYKDDHIFESNGDDCGVIPSQIKWDCTSETCIVKKASSHSDKPSHYIEWLYTKKGGTLQILQSWMDTSSNVYPAAHMSAIAEIKLTSPQPSFSHSCSVSTTDISNGVTVEVSGQSSSLGPDPVEGWVMRDGNTRIPPSQRPVNLLEHSYVRDGVTRYYYQISNSQCDSRVNCTKSSSVLNVPIGQYKAFCHMSQTGLPCSGNPNIEVNGGPIPLDGWDSCGNQDVTSFSIQSSVTPTSVPPTPTDVPATPTSQPPTSTPSLDPVVDPDYDNNGFVDILDYSQLIQVFGTQSCEYNLVGGCVISILDYTELLLVFGEYDG